MAGDNSLCEFKSSDKHNNTAEVVPLIFLFPCQLCFATFFLRQLYLHTKIDTKNTMVIATIVYILLTLFVSFTAFYNEILDPIRQTKFGPIMNLCRIATFTEWICASAQYCSLIEVFLARLSSVFRGSTNEVSDYVRWSFRIAFGCVITLSLASAVFRVIVMNCYVEKSYGFLAKASIFPKRARHCSFPPKYLWMRVLATGAIVVVFTVSVILLLYMFVRRLRRLDKMGQELGIENMIGFQQLIDKSAIITAVGLSSTMFSLILAGNTGYSPVIYTDILLNNVLLYCLFSFGDPLFDQLFGWMLKLVRKPVQPLILEKHISVTSPGPHQMTTATLSDVEEDDP